MKITFYPRYPKRTASSRLRAYWIQEYLLEKGAEAVIASSPFTSDIIMFQKIFAPFHIKLARRAREKGIITIFDIDDNYPNPMMSKVDLVTVDSVKRKEWVRKYEKKTKIKVITDPIDYLKQPIPRRSHTKKDDLRIIFFAGPANLDCIKVCKGALLELGKSRDFTFDYVTGIPDYKGYDKYFKGLNANFIQWQYSSFSNLLRTYDFAILPQVVKEKSSTKLTQSIAHNVPVVATNIPSYEKVAKATGTLEFLCTNNQEWLEAMNKMFDPKVRNEYLRKTLDWTWKNHGLEVIGKRWLRLFMELVFDREA